MQLTTLTICFICAVIVTLADAQTWRQRAQRQIPFGSRRNNNRGQLGNRRGLISDRRFRDEGEFFDRRDGCACDIGYECNWDRNECFNPRNPRDFYTMPLVPQGSWGAGRRAIGGLVRDRVMPVIGASKLRNSVNKLARTKLSKGYNAMFSAAARKGLSARGLADCCLVSVPDSCFPPAVGYNAAIDPLCQRWTFDPMQEQCVEIEILTSQAGFIGNPRYPQYRNLYENRVDCTSRCSLGANRLGGYWESHAMGLW